MLRVSTPNSVTAEAPGESWICGKCSTIPFKEKPWDWSIPHYGTFAELDQSSQNGCSLCILFRNATIEFHARFVFRQSTKMAESFHRSLDNAASIASILDQSPDMSQYIEEEEEKEEELRTCFFVEAISVDIDDRFANLESGLLRLIYVRKESHDDERTEIPLLGVVPYLNITCIAGSIPSLKWNMVGRPVPTMVEYTLASQWINDCLETHVQCTQQARQQLPTRVLDLGTSTEDSDVRLLVNPTEYQHYAALSHCWGKSRPLRLTMANYDAFQKTITYTSLPKTFQDAATVSRALGLRYLWIDSLCIVQDSKRDWEEQCKCMADIYQNSFVTIAGSAAPSSESGFLHPRQPSYPTTLRILDEEVSAEFMISPPGGVGEDPFDLRPEPNSPLAQRGWVLQERLLSPRMLYFGSQNMYFECFTTVRFDYCHHPVRWSSQETELAIKRLVKSLPDASQRFTQWIQIISTFGSLMLTKSTDKLPALSGLASDFQRVTKCKYLSGLWYEDMHRILAWYIPYYRWQTDPPLHTSQEYIAPSWSWAAAKHRFDFISLDYSEPCQEDLQIVDAGVTPSGLDPLGQVKDGYLKVRGKLRHAVVRNLPDRIVRGRRTLYIYSEGLPSEPLGVYAPNEIADISSEFKLLMIYIGTFNRRVAALVVKALEPNNNHYIRLGLAYTEYGDSGDALRGYFEGLNWSEPLLLK